MVTGTLPILKHYTLILFDSESYSFILLVFVKHDGSEVDPLGYVLSLSTSLGEIILSNEKNKSTPYRNSKSSFGCNSISSKQCMILM